MKDCFQNIVKTLPDGGSRQALPKTLSRQPEGEHILSGGMRREPGLRAVRKVEIDVTPVRPETVVIRYGLDKIASGFESAATSADRLGEDRYQVTMNGNLPLHGAAPFAPVSVTGEALWAVGERILVAGGAPKLKDELKLAFDIVARKQE